jgi:hypothetical protein
VGVGKAGSMAGRILDVVCRFLVGSSILPDSLRANNLGTSSTQSGVNARDAGGRGLHSPVAPKTRHGLVTNLGAGRSDRIHELGCRAA